MNASLTEKDYQNAAARLGVPVAAFKAVATVESNGGGFLSDGRVKIQYEPHVMYRRLLQHYGKARADKELAAHHDLVATKAGSYQSLDKEDKDMDRAANIIDRQCALESASWGAFQIMGYHWQALGYSSLQAFVNAMYSGEEAQLDAFVRFILLTPALVDALRASDWAKVARLYNGPDYKKNNYDAKLNQEFIKAGGK